MAYQLFSLGDPREGGPRYRAINARESVGFPPPAKVFVRGAGIPCLDKKAIARNEQRLVLVEHHIASS